MEDDNGNEADGEVTPTCVVTASRWLARRTGLYGLGLHIARLTPTMVYGLRGSNNPVTYTTHRILGYIDPSPTAAQVNGNHYPINVYLFCTVQRVCTSNVHGFYDTDICNI